ncbi:MAG: ribonuclease P protein subunit [Candidatus Micrarchaeia archaeon]
MTRQEGLERACLIGLECAVVKSACRELEGAKGTVLRETKNTLWLAGSGRPRIIPKSPCRFRFFSGGKSLGEIDGKEICSRPEDRMKKS